MAHRGKVDARRQRQQKAGGVFAMPELSDLLIEDGSDGEEPFPDDREPFQRRRTAIPAVSQTSQEMRTLAARASNPREDFQELQKELLAEPLTATSRVTPAPGQILYNLTPQQSRELDQKRVRLNIGSFEQRFDADSRFRETQEEQPDLGIIQFNLTTTTDGRTSDIPVAPVNIVELKVGSFLFPRSIIARYLDPNPGPDLTQVIRRHPFNNDLVRMLITVMRNTGVEKAFFNRYHILFRVHRWTDPETVGDNTATPSSELMVRLVPEIEGRIIFNRPIEIHGAFPLQFLDAFGPIPLNRDRFPIFSGFVVIGAGPSVTISLTIDDPNTEFDFVVGERVILIQEDGNLFRPNAPFEPWGYTITTVTLPVGANPVVTITVAPPADFANTGPAFINASDGAFLFSIDRQIQVPIWFRSLSEVDTNYMTLTTS